MATTTELSKIDLNLLVLFEAVYSTGAIGAAAERLHITQPAVSMGLKRLRELTDDPLFARTGRGIAPTAKANQLIGPVREALGIIGRQLGTGGAVDLATWKRHFRIVMVDPMEPIVMPPILRRITTDAPGISIESVVGTRDFGAELKGGQLDMACFGYLIDGPEIRSVAIDQYDLVIVARRGHPGIPGKLDAATYRMLWHITLNRELQAVANVVKDMVANAVTRHAPYRVSKLWSKPAIIESTDLIGLLPRRFAEHAAARYAIDIHEVPVPMPAQHIYLMWHERNDDDPGHRWLREAIIQAAKVPPAAAAPANKPPVKARAKATSAAPRRRRRVSPPA